MRSLGEVPGSIAGPVVMFSPLNYATCAAQERIMTQPYGSEGELFTFSLFLVLSNRLTTCALSMACLLVLPLPTCTSESAACMP